MTTGGAELALLASTAADLFGDHCTAQACASGWDPALWRVLEESGLTLVSVPEDAGGAGGSLLEAAALVSVAGEHAAPVPLADTAVLGAWLLAEAGLEVPAGPVPAAAGALTLHRADTGGAGGWAVRGRLERVPWARAASRVAVLVPEAPGAAAGGETVVALDPASCTLLEGANLAGEPRDTLEVDTLVPAAAVAAVAAGTHEVLRRRAALARTVQLAGAGERVLALTLDHVSVREQFGRPLGAFQAVQQQVAELAAEVAVTRAAADAAVGRCAAAGFAGDDSGIAVAAAKTAAAQSAGVIARIAHQMHGAIGFTDEHVLRLSTTRLWAWRDEYGNDADWGAGLGTAALEAGRAGEAGLWAMITAAS